MFLAMFGVLWCFLCLLVYDTSYFEYSFGALEAHTSVFEFRNSNLASNGSFVTVGNAVLDVYGLIYGIVGVFGCVWGVVVFPVLACVCYKLC